MRTRRCEHCGDHLSARHAHNARFCSTRCRVAAHRASRRLPRELTTQARWVRRTERKAPLTAEGRPASSTDPATWCSHREAMAGRAGVGLGFVLDGDGIVCLDLDGALDADGRVAAWAQRILDAAPGCWGEVSVSGRGLHVWGHGSLPGGHGRRLSLDPGSVELYERGRYIAVTGRTWGDTPRRLGDLQPVIDMLL